MKRFQSLIVTIFITTEIFIISNCIAQKIDQKLPNLSASIPENQKTKILVLASEHLSRLGKKFKPSLLDSVLFYLERYKPDVIAVESMPASIIEYMYNHGGSYKKFIENSLSIKYGKIIQNQLNITRFKANQMADSLLQKLYTTRNISNIPRQKLILYLIASYDLESAVLQFSYLPKDSQEDFPDLPDDISSFLEKSLRSSNEIYSIGVTLANRLNIQEIESIDDHQDVDQSLIFVDSLFHHIDFNAVFKTPCFKKYIELVENGIKSNDLLKFYKYINSYEFLSSDVEFEYGSFFNTDIPNKLGRSFISCMEVRNLNITSHIRKCTTFCPGKKILVIIGASHKAFLDNYLNNLMDVKVVQFADFVI